MLPAPAGLPVEPTPANTAVHVAPEITPGRLSVTVAPVTKLGPRLATVIVYAIGLPAVYVALPSVLVTLRSDTGAGVSVSVALLLPPTGSVVPPGTAAEAVFA